MADRSRRVRRGLVALAITGALVALPGAAVAKMPFVSVEVSPASPVAGEPVLVDVRLWNDVEHTSPADWGMPEMLDDLFVLRGPEGVADVDVILRQATPDHYTATVVVPSAGAWTLVAFPDLEPRGIPPGYPDTLPIAVREAPREPAGFVDSIVQVVLGLLRAIAASAAPA